ncbi:MAG: hypothetical protein HC876_15225 [Chloroflexaceae bacterium]|nr:hypothetical protein [Chloroflexaceae bacterium]
MHTPPGTASHIVATHTAETVHVEVLAEGPGIPEALLPHIFEKFGRAVASERPAVGSGLGLAICQGL